MQKIIPFLWFNNQAEEAVNFYILLFKNSKIESVSRYGKEGAEVSGMPKGSVMTLDFQLEGQEFVAINGGPVFTFSQAVSFFVSCKTPEEIDELWEKLSDGGKVLMKLAKYPFSEKYGWIQDKFGVSWQLILSSRAQKIAPCLMFTGEQHKKAEEAINFYISIFKNSFISTGNSNTIQLERYKAGEGPEGAVVHAKFVLTGHEFIAMDSHTNFPFTFNPSISFIINCETQEEVDYYWEKLSKDGDESAQQCGWIKDKYGVSWQIVPIALTEMLNDPDSVKTQKVMKAMLKMKKIDIGILKQAYDG